MARKIPAQIKLQGDHPQLEFFQVGLDYAEKLARTPKDRERFPNSPRRQDTPAHEPSQNRTEESEQNEAT